jgi:hypothetical protein
MDENCSIKSAMELLDLMRADHKAWALIFPTDHQQIHQRGWWIWRFVDLMGLESPHPPTPNWG